MTIRLIRRGNRGELVLIGRLDSLTAQETEDIFMQQAERFDDIVLNMEQMEYISSAGLRVLKKLHMAIRQKNGTLTLKNVNKMVMEVFEMTGFAGLFRFSSTL